MQLVFCADPLRPWSPDPAFKREVEAAGKLEIQFHVVDFEALTGKAGVVRIRGEPPTLREPAIYRGWMLKPAQYEVLRAGLLDRQLELVNTTDQYRHCHHLPESYPVIAAHSPRTVWLRGPVDRGAISSALATFGNAPLVLKDFVKSRKHEWAEACFIPDASDAAAVERVVDRFLELTGEDLNEGLVFREFLPLESIGSHSRSGLPLAREYRRFFLDGEEILSARYWDEGAYEEAVPPVGLFADVATQVRSRFFTMDVARLASGGWIIVELGDAQVSGLPDNADPTALFSLVNARLR